MSITEVTEITEAAGAGASIIAVTDAAVRRMKSLRDRRGDATLGVRIGVKGGGCSGLSYVLALEPGPMESDIVHEFDGIRVWIDPKSARFLQGTTLDFNVKNLLEGGWVFQNPNASRTCGCGTSFQPKG
jgi:iron-sulfur cluster assembly protein